MNYVVRGAWCVMRGMQPTLAHGRDDMLDREGFVRHDDALD